jgi:hypothetical protein
MEAKIAKFVAFMITAAMAAATLGHLAHGDLGLSRHTIRDDAVLAAVLTGGFLLIYLFSSRFGKLK